MPGFFDKQKIFSRLIPENPRRGIAIYLAISMLSVVMAVALGVSILSVYQIKNMNEAGNSVIAFAAAETGIEWAEYQCFVEPAAISLTVDPGDPTYYANVCGWDAELGAHTCAKNINLGTGVTYTVTVATNAESVTCPSGYLCIKSSGSYRGTQRVIKIQQ